MVDCKICQGYFAVELMAIAENNDIEIENILPKNGGKQMTTEEQKAVEEAASKLNWLQQNSFIKGAQFLSDLRKPSEPETKVGEAGEEFVNRIEKSY